MNTEEILKALKDIRHYVDYADDFADSAYNDAHSACSILGYLDVEEDDDPQESVNDAYREAFDAENRCTDVRSNLSEAISLMEELVRSLQEPQSVDERILELRAKNQTPEYIATYLKLPLPQVQRVLAQSF